MRDLLRSNAASARKKHPGHSHGRAKPRAGESPTDRAGVPRAGTPVAATPAHPEVGNGHAVFPIEQDETLGRLVAMFLYQRLFGSGPASGRNAIKDEGLLRKLGWPEDLVREIGSMPIDDIARILSGSPGTCLGVVFDARKAAGVVNSYRALRREEQELEFFIVNGATPTLIRTLFPNVGARVVGQLRKRLGCESRGGRPPLPEAQTTYEIYRTWQTLCAQHDSPRARYMQLKRHYPALSLATLCTAIETY